MISRRVVSSNLGLTKITNWIYIPVKPGVYMYILIMQHFPVVLREETTSYKNLTILFGSSLEKKFFDFHIHFKVFMYKLDVMEK